MPECGTDLEETKVCDEQRRVVLRRFDEAREAGLTRVEALRFAESDADVGLLRRLVGAGCAARLMADIIL